MSKQGVVDRWSTKRNPEKGGRTSLVKTAGYMTTKQKVESFTAAGMRLQAWRERFYDANSGGPEGDLPIDPTDAYDFDEMAAIDTGRTVRERLRKMRENQQAALKNVLGATPGAPGAPPEVKQEKAPD